MKKTFHKIRSHYHKPTKAHVVKTVYNRKKEKQSVYNIIRQREANDY